ncbi:hypothetical protein MBLNU230_g8530t1 [Neophaeotheca triangularis]
MAAQTPDANAPTAMDIDTDTTVDETLLAATNHDNTKLRTLLKTAPDPRLLANAQDPDTGYTPLHAAIAACEADDDDDDDDNTSSKETGDAIHNRALPEEAATETVKLLFEFGAIWNELDFNDETPGCLALRLGLKGVYEAVVEAGVRAEMLFGRMDAYLPLSGEEEGDAVEVTEELQGGAKQSSLPGADVEAMEVVEGAPGLKATSAEGTEGEVDENAGPVHLKNPNVNNPDYLASKLTYSQDRLLDEDKNAVMMDWEDEIMGRSVDAMCKREGLRTMNVGHGMGIVDGKFLDKKPAMHHICEAHPEVLARMREKGWMNMPNVTVHEGKWQDTLPKLAEQGVVLDAIYYDTYAEDYSDLKEFFAEHVIALLDPQGKFGFYNGLGADRQVCYDVYTKVVELDLFEAGMDTEWEVLKVPDLDGEGQWKGVRRKYWDVDVYRLPTCTFIANA